MNSIPIEGILNQRLLIWLLTKYIWGNRARIGHPGTWHWQIGRTNSRQAHNGADFAWPRDPVAGKICSAQRWREGHWAESADRSWVAWLGSLPQGS